MDINDLSGSVIESAIKIHTAIGPRCFERVYEEIRYYELKYKGLKIERRLVMPIEYENLFSKDAYKVDLLNLKNGMLLNFKVNKMKEGIHRVFNNFGN